MKDLVWIFPVSANYPAAAPQAEVLLQEITIGSGIKFAQMALHRRLMQPYRQACVMGVYGKGGIGKTSLLTLIHNNYRQVSGIHFDLVICLTVSIPENEENKNKDSIVRTFSLKMEGSFDVDMRKMKLSACLENKRSVLMLDDVWSPMDLNTVGVKFGDDNCSKFLISTGNRDVIEEI